MIVARVGRQSVQPYSYGATVCAMTISGIFGHAILPVAFVTDCIYFVFTVLR